MNRSAAEVRLPLGLLHLFSHAFELPLANAREILAVRRGSRGLIEEDGDARLRPDALADALGERDALLHRDIANRNKRNHIHRAHARMLARVSG
ncbi:hypothetical protein SDC9_185136 [bioreactor metagenome]|uniref:Uncharacterized protein n=1 Tax=bioreactor metagenome TaxID=1076179 RepID=A0A645HGB9_9ZZZZ